MEIIEVMEGEGYEQLLIATDQSVGLRALVAIHDTTLGPALGGCRIWPHATEDEAISDVLRLAKAMTYKNALAGLDNGGGKALMWMDSTHGKTDAMLRAFGEQVDILNGRYWTTEDVGSTVDDMVVVRSATKYVVGLPTELGGSGDPSKATALGVFRGMKSTVSYALNVDSMTGMTVVLQGFGKVAKYLAPYLLAEKARLIVTDINRDNLAYAGELGCLIHEDPSTVYDIECEIFAPCAMGGSINTDTIPRLRSKIVAGCANNQLRQPADGFELRNRDILYIPDFVINAGGVINLSFEMGKQYNEDDAMDRVKRIYDSVSELLRMSEENQVSPVEAAESLAEQRIASVRDSR